MLEIKSLDPASLEIRDSAKRTLIQFFFIQRFNTPSKNNERKLISILVRGGDEVTLSQIQTPKGANYCKEKGIRLKAWPNA